MSSSDGACETPETKGETSDYNNAAHRAKSNLDEGYSQCIAFNLALYGVAHFANKLVWDHKHQNVCILGCLHQIRHCHLKGKKEDTSHTCFQGGDNLKKKKRGQTQYL